MDRVIKITLLLALFPLLAIAQTDTTKRKVIVYNQDDYFGGHKEINNVLKINTVLVFTGDIPVYFERVLNKKISAEAAIGVTTRNYLRDLWDYSANPFYLENPNETYNYSDIIGKMGYSLRLGLRYFPTQDVSAPHEFYVGPAIEFRRYNYAVPKAEYDPFSMAGYTLSLTEEVGGSRNITDLKVMFGYVDFFEKNIMVEYYGGVGIRFKSEDRFIIEEVAQPQGGNIPQTTIVDDVRTAPIFSAGVKLGFGWK